VLIEENLEIELAGESVLVVEAKGSQEGRR
jgi:hypothetical protein